MISTAHINTSTLSDPIFLNFGSFLSDRNKKYKLKVTGSVFVDFTTHFGTCFLTCNNLVQPRSYDNVTSGNNKVIGISAYKVADVYNFEGFETIINFPVDNYLDIKLLDSYSTQISDDNILNVNLLLQFEEINEN